MKKIDLGQSITILANIGVIAGIVFLAIELRQNNELLAAQARSDRVALRQADTTLVIENPELLNALVKNGHGEPLTVHENVLLSRYLDFVLVNLQNVYMEMNRGLIAEDSIPVEAWRASFMKDRRANSNFDPNLLEYWNENKIGFDSRFVEWMEENIVNR